MAKLRNSSKGDSNPRMRVRRSTAELPCSTSVDAVKVLTLCKTYITIHGVANCRILS